MEASENTALPRANVKRQILPRMYYLSVERAVCRKSPIIHTIASIADTSYIDPRTIRNEWYSITARFIRTDRMTGVQFSLTILQTINTIAG